MRLIALLFSLFATQAGAQSKACIDELREAYVGLSIVPTQVAEALSQARADGVRQEPDALQAPEEFQQMSDEWSERIIELTEDICGAKAP